MFPEVARPLANRTGQIVTDFRRAFVAHGADLDRLGNAAGEDILRNWKHYAWREKLLEPELILPILAKQIAVEEFLFLDRARLRLSAAEIAAASERLKPWMYFVDFGNGVRTLEIVPELEGMLRFHRYRASLISETVAELLGAEMTGASVIDLGCNCGFFSLEAAAYGAKQVLGVDVRENNIEQSRFLARAFGFDNAHFETANVKDWRTTRTFDVVLNLGLMYHLTSPYEVMRNCYEMTGRFCLIDTLCHQEPVSGYMIIASKNAASPIEGDLGFEMGPTYRGLIETMRAVGFRNIIEIVGITPQPVDLYDSMYRRCLIGFKDDPAPYLENWVRGQAKRPAGTTLLPRPK